MHTLLIILSVIVAILLIIVVLIQKSKGGGLASGFSGANQIMGVRHTNNFIEKTTWTLAGIIAAIAIVYALLPKSTGDGTPTVTGVQSQQTEQTDYPAGKPAAEQKAAPAAEKPAAPVAPAAPAN